ncbi:hypothetical protein [Sediminispirochaeta bajacaliforniensis]|uniref:hypothetical protein n=1 Tax=Sediminispirochaeta bajacaliforniensis TaxID=148 RepID=UPI00035F1920|nr:hypothetical protein [Sediminispirochaeta bajacaliforniensis]
MDMNALDKKTAEAIRSVGIRENIRMFKSGMGLLKKKVQLNDKDFDVVLESYKLTREEAIVNMTTAIRAAEYYTIHSLEQSLWSCHAGEDAE